MICSLCFVVFTMDLVKILDGKSREKIIALLSENGKLTAAGLAAEIGVTAKAVEKHQPNRHLTFFKSEDARHLLEKLPGQKFLIQGNHDGSIRAYSNYFKPTACPFHQYAKQNYRSEVR